MTTAIAHEAKPGTENAPAWLAGFKADYEAIFVEQWSPYLGSILVVFPYPFQAQHRIELVGHKESRITSHTD